MHLRSLDGCRLAIGKYPHFHYDARNGGGRGKLVENIKDHVLRLSFEPKTFSIPSLTSKNTKFLAFPLPPGLKIEMCMDSLEGTINKKSGEVILNFESRFIFTIGSFLRFPNLFVKTTLHTGKIKTSLHKEDGISLQKNGRAKLVGVAMIPITGNKVLDLFLGLPNEALAVLQCEIK